MQFENIILNNLIWVGSLLLVNLFVGLVSMPLCGLLFGKLSDKGYSIASIIGFFCVSYIVFVLATLKILPLNWISILVVLGIWIGINYYIQKKLRPIDIKTIDKKQLVKLNIVFLVLFLFMYLIKSYQAEIYQIERFMDYGFIKALFNSTTLPLKDIWFSGENLNYYYFSHFVAYVILRLTAIPPEPGFYIVTSWIFAVMGLNIFRIAKEIALLLQLKGKVFAFIAGVISVFWGIFGGVLHSVTWIYKTFSENPGSGFLFGWYAEPTRIISGTITEIPIYTYIVAELHPHMWGMLSAVIIISVIVAHWKSDKAFNILSSDYWLVAIFLGMAFMINSWDVVTLGVLTAVAIAGRKFIIVAKGNEEHITFKTIRINIKKGISSVGLMILSLGLLPVLAVGFALPWKYYFEAPVSGVGLVKNISNFGQWFSFWGQFVIILIVFSIVSIQNRSIKKYFKMFWKNTLNANEGKQIIWIIAFAAVIFWIVMEIFYIKDILLEGEWYRANTFFKITTQVWLWLSVITGPIIVYVLVNAKGWFGSKLIFFTIWLIFSICTVFPIKTIWQGGLENKAFRGIECGLDFWKNKYPDDYLAYEYLEKVRKDLPEGEKMKVILEAEGDSYKDNNYFSTFLGWQSVVGWPVHEWTWRGSYDEVGKRRGDVVEVYTGSDASRAEEILDKYGVDYIIIGQIEREKYGSRINNSKLNSLGTIVFETGLTRVVEIKN